LVKQVHKVHKDQLALAVSWVQQALKATQDQLVHKVYMSQVQQDKLVQLER
jgi:hypothetical protein